MTAENHQRPDYVPRRRLEREREARRNAERLLEEKGRQLFEAQKARDRFLTNMNHEFRTPLNGILGSAELLQQVNQPDDVRELASVIEDCAEQLLVLLEASVHAARGSPVCDEGYDEATAPLVLIVDDNPVNRMVAKAAVEAIGMRTSMAKDGAEAMETMAEHPPDAVLMDLEMPVMNGPQTIREIRSSDQPWRKVPIIVLTANAEPRGRQRSLEFGATDYMTKPINVGRLQSTLKNVIEAKDTPYPGLP